MNMLKTLGAVHTHTHTHTGNLIKKNNKHRNKSYVF